MKKTLFSAIVAACTGLLFVACSDDDTVHGDPSVLTKGMLTATVDGNPMYFVQTGDNEVAVTYDMSNPLHVTRNYTSTTLRVYDYTGDVVVPATVTIDGKTYNVTAATDEAFLANWDMKTLTLAPSIKKIGTAAGALCYKKISDSEIYGPTALDLSGVEDIGEGAFRGSCNIVTDLTLSDNLTSIGRYAFYGLAKVTDLNIQGSLTEIGDYAFYGCSGLKTLSLPEGLTRVGNYAFTACAALADCTFPSTLTEIGDSAFARIKVTNLVIPGTVKTLGRYAFNYGTSKTIVMEEGVETLGDYCFSGQRNKGVITVPASVTTVGKGCFDAFYIKGTDKTNNNIATVTYYNGATAVHMKSSVPPTATGSLTPLRNELVDNGTSATTLEALNMPGYPEKGVEGVTKLTLYVPKGSKAAYEAAPYWNEIENIVEE